MLEPSSLSAYLPSSAPPERFATIVIPRALQVDARQIAKEEPLCHPIWGKLRNRGEQLLALATCLEDVEELADFAFVELYEPRRQSSKNRRDACKALLDRCHRLIEMEVIGDVHILALRWRPEPLVGARFSHKEG
jgi:hypothetical protein